MNMARANAETRLAEKRAVVAMEMDLARRLQKKLNLARLPIHIECVDNSNISGRSPVAGLVVFKHGKPEKTYYRRYILNEIDIPDDYANMAEVLRRRFGKENTSPSLPDLLMVDGGKGQINIAVSILTELQIVGNIDVIGIAKKDKTKGETHDKIFLPRRSNPVVFGRDEELLLFLQRIRDEAHRFAIAFHRRRRSKKSIHSILDTIHGIGEKRKKTLLKQFGSVSKIRAAHIDELMALPGMNRKAAESLMEGLNTENVSPPDSIE